MRLGMDWFRNPVTGMANERTSVWESEGRSPSE